jgi:hypothetical protein
VATVIRSVGIRDLVIGLGLLRAAQRSSEQDMRRWLLARAACDTGDTLAVAVAIAAGARSPRFYALGALAASAGATGIAIALARSRY